MSSLSEKYELAKKRGKGEEFLAKHPKFAAKLAGKDGGGTPPPSGDQAPPAQPEPPAKVDPEALRQEVSNILTGASGYGTTFADDISNKYLKDAFGTVDAETSQEMRDLLTRMNEWSKSAGNMTDYEKKALDEMEKGLAGYAAPEVQAMREQAMQEINRQYLTAMQQQAIQQARSGVRGAAAGAQAQDLGVARTQAAGNLERDLVVKNAEEIQNRRSAFANTVRSTEDARFGRQSSANAMYGGALSGEEAARSSREMFNANQNTNKGLTQAGLATTGAGLYTGLYGTSEANQIAQNNFDALLKKAQADSAWMQDFSKRQLDMQNKWANMYYN